jgi:hypothetical protein
MGLSIDRKGSAFNTGGVAALVGNTYGAAEDESLLRRSQGFTASLPTVTCALVRVEPGCGVLRRSTRGADVGCSIIGDEKCGASSPKRGTAI